MTHSLVPQTRSQRVQRIESWHCGCRLCAEVNVDVQQILGVSIVECPLCVVAFAPVAGVPLPCCPSCALAPQSLCPSTSLWLSPRFMWELRLQSQSLQSIALTVAAFVSMLGRQLLTSKLVWLWGFELYTLVVVVAA